MGGLGAWARDWQGDAAGQVRARRASTWPPTLARGAGAERALRLVSVSPVEEMSAPPPGAALPKAHPADPSPVPVDRGGPQAPPPASNNQRRGRTWLSRGRTARQPPVAVGVGPPWSPWVRYPATPRRARRVRTAVRTGSDRLTEAAPVTLSRDRRPKRAAWVLAPIPPGRALCRATRWRGRPGT